MTVMCLRTGAREFMSPFMMLHNFTLWIRLSIADLFHTSLSLQRAELIAASPYYFETISRFRNLVDTAICGSIIAIGGATYQVIFKNPMAAPTMLGVGSGISLGLLLLVTQYSVQAYAMVKERFIYCFGLSILMLLIVIAAGRFMGKGRRSVTDMLLIGSVFAQIAGAITTFVRMRMELEELQILQTLSMYGFTVNTDYEFAGTAMLVIIGLFILCMFPIYMMRSSFDALSFSDEESKMMGINSGVVRAVALLLVTTLVIIAILYCGTIGALSLAVPHICRYMFGSRFKNVFLGSAFMGALLLIICRGISSMIYLEGMGFFPIGTIAGLVCAPLLAMVLSQRRRGWE